LQNTKTSRESLISLQPARSTTDCRRLLPGYALINADIGRGRDWVARVGLSERFGIMVADPEYWQLYFVQGTGLQTIILDNDVFFRAGLNGDHFGIYVDSDGQIICLPEKVFQRALDRRFRDGVATVDFSWDGDWYHDRFCRRIPTARLGGAALDY
jgi:hypothetical protein